MDTLIQWDEWLLLAVNGAYTPFRDAFMFLVSDKWIWIPLYAAILYAIWRSYGWRTTLVIVVTMAIAITCADQICSHVIRPMVQRLRPTNAANPLSEFVHVVNNCRGGRYGFPSSHAGNTFAAATLSALFLRRPRYVVFIYLWALLVCYSRICLGVHYPGDILVGLTIGTLVGMACYYGARYVIVRLKLTDTPLERRYQPSDMPILVGLTTIAVIALLSI